MEEPICCMACECVHVPVCVCKSETEGEKERERETDVCKLLKPPSVPASEPWQA